MYYLSWLLSFLASLYVLDAGWMDLYLVPVPFRHDLNQRAELFLRLAKDTSWLLFSASKLKMSGWTLLADNCWSPEWPSYFVICVVMAEVLLSVMQELTGIGSLGGSVNSVYAVDGLELFRPWEHTARGLVGAQFSFWCPVQSLLLMFVEELQPPLTSYIAHGMCSAVCPDLFTHTRHCHWCMLTGKRL